jgi:hypothetical protein
VRSQTRLQSLRGEKGVWALRTLRCEAGLRAVRRLWSLRPLWRRSGFLQQQMRCAASRVGEPMRRKEGMRTLQPVRSQTRLQPLRCESV